MSRNTNWTAEDVAKFAKRANIAHGKIFKEEVPKIQQPARQIEYPPKFVKTETHSGTEIKMVIHTAKPQTAVQRTQALGRLKKGKMNKTEQAYARHLEALKFAGEIIDYWFEEIKFKIGTSACWYEPDFLVQVKSGALEIHECKGHWQEDALVKIKSLAFRYPYRVIALKLIKGQWEVREFN